ncbi:hypothetical protein MGN70_001770 [Eutypa lata]|nr:hypothetical protein MGN70_001770 [Eutypa lata]
MVAWVAAPKMASPVATPPSMRCLTLNPSRRSCRIVFATRGDLCPSPHKEALSRLPTGLLVIAIERSLDLATSSGIADSVTLCIEAHCPVNLLVAGESCPLGNARWPVLLRRR